MGNTPAELGQQAARSEGQSHKRTSECQRASNGVTAGAALASPRSEPHLSDEAAEQAFRKHLREDMGASRACRCFKIIDIVEGR